MCSEEEKTVIVRLKTWKLLISHFLDQSVCYCVVIKHFFLPIFNILYKKVHSEYRTCSDEGSHGSLSSTESV